MQDRELPGDWKSEQFWAKALLIEETGEQLLLMTTDLLWVSDEMRSAVATAAVQRGLSAERVMLAASHTHSGPQTLRTPNPMPGAPDAKWLRTLESTLFELVGETLDAKPMEVLPRIAFGRYPGVINRLRPVWVRSRRGFSRRLVLLPNPLGPRDEQVRVLGFVRPDGHQAAVVFGYSCHPTILNGPGLSRDYPGAASDRVTELTGAEAFFLLGFAGDQRPDLRENWEHMVRHPVAFLRYARSRTARFRYGTYSEMERFGHTLGDEVVRALTCADELHHARGLDARLVHVSVPMELGGTAPLIVQRFSLGSDLTFLGIGSEVFLDFSSSARKAFDTRNVWPVGLANGVIAYLCPQDVAHLKPYGAGMSLRPELGVPVPWSDEVVHFALKVVTGAGESHHIPAITLRAVTDPDYPECRAAYAEYSPQYHDPVAWRARMLGVGGDRLIAVGAYTEDGTWSGGFVTYPLPMRGPDGTRLRGGKMEAMIVAPHARGGVFRCDDGRVEKLSVALSRRLIDVSLSAGLEIFFGVPNEPALRAHRMAGHCIVRLPHYRLEVALGPGFWQRKSGVRALALRVIGGWQLLRRRPQPVGEGLLVKAVERFGIDVDAFDDAHAKTMPSIDIVRSAAFFRWRYDGYDYIRLECRDGDGRLFGTLLGQRLPREGILSLIDVAVDRSRSCVWSALIDTYLSHAKKVGAHTVTFTSIGNGPLARSQRAALRKAGFVSYPPSQLEWIVDGANGVPKHSLVDPTQWSFSGLFSDSL